MRFQLLCAGLAGVALSTQASGQAAPSSASMSAAPLMVSQAQARNTAVLPANTEIGLAMNETITTKGKRWNEGDTFGLTVTQNVMLGGYVVIPRGSRGVGRITYLTSKGAFGKSGKMEIDLEYVEVAGRRIPVTGHYRQEGEGNTVGTVAGVVAVGVFAGFVTGKSGVIPQGRELVAHMRDDLPVSFDQPVDTALAAPVPLSVRATGAPASPRPVAATPAASTRGAASTAAPVVVNDFSVPVGH